MGESSVLFIQYDVVRSHKLGTTKGDATFGSFAHGRAMGECRSGLRALHRENVLASESRTAIFASRTLASDAACDGDGFGRQLGNCRCDDGAEVSVYFRGMVLVFRNVGSRDWIGSSRDAIYG